VLSILSALSVAVHPKTLTGIAGPLVLANSLDILRSASRRNRLDGGTFKWLNLGSCLFFAASLMKQAQKINGDLQASLISRLIFFSYGAVVPIASLIKFGLPKLKLEYPNALAAIYFVSTSFLWCIILMFYCFIVNLSFTIGFGSSYYSSSATSGANWFSITEHRFL
jgi:hypothetical protein